MKSPKERTQLFEEISGSKEHSIDYDKKNTELAAAEEDANFSYQKKKVRLECFANSSIGLIMKIFWNTA